jgi:hypothetical protein
LIEFINEIVSEMYEYRNASIILLEVVTTMFCGKELNDSDYWSLGRLNEIYEQIIIPCDTPCENAHKYNELFVCKPSVINYNRVHSNKKDTSGVLEPTLTFTEMKAKYGTNNNRC